MNTTPTPATVRATQDRLRAAAKAAAALPVKLAFTTTTGDKR